jgi:hypothetical protein
MIVERVETLSFSYQVALFSSNPGLMLFKRSLVV